MFYSIHEIQLVLNNKSREPENTTDPFKIMSTVYKKSW